MYRLPPHGRHLTRTLVADAWPLGQDVCKIIKQRCREICPTVKVFLDVEDMSSGSGTKEVDHS
eukprot:5598957-Prymnesium_polylepis.1